MAHRTAWYRSKLPFSLPSAAMLRSGARALAQLHARSGVRGYNLVPVVIEQSGCVVPLLSANAALKPLPRT